MLAVYTTIIFDLDGTLADTLQDIASSANAVLTALGRDPHPVDAYRTFVGEGMRMLMQRVLTLPGRPAPSAEVVDDAYVRMEAEYAQRKFDTTCLYPGVRELLDQLKVHHVATGVLSNKPHPFTVELVAHLFADDDFRAVYGHRPPLPRKPDPSTVIALAAELGASPAQVVYVGDTRTDMETAVNAGMLPVGVSWGFRTVDELLQHGAAHIVDAPLQLWTLL